MKKRNLLMLMVFFTVNCTKEDTSSTQSIAVSVIGVDPCTVNYPMGTSKKGYLLLLNNSKDTVVTYSLPDNLSKQIDGNLKLKDNYLLTSDAIVTQQLSIRFANKDEKVFPLCNGMVNTAGFAKYTEKQVIIE